MERATSQQQIHFVGRGAVESISPRDELLLKLTGTREQTPIPWFHEQDSWKQTSRVRGISTWRCQASLEKQVRQALPRVLRFSWRKKSIMATLKEPGLQQNILATDFFLFLLNYFFFVAILCNSERWLCMETPVDQQFVNLLRQVCLAPTSMHHSISLPSPFIPASHLDWWSIVLRDWTFCLSLVSEQYGWNCQTLAYFSNICQQEK